MRVDRVFIQIGSTYVVGSCVCSAVRRYYWSRRGVDGLCESVSPIGRLSWTTWKLNLCFLWYDNMRIKRSQWLLVNRSSDTWRSYGKLHGVTSELYFGRGVDDTQISINWTSGFRSWITWKMNSCFLYLWAKRVIDEGKSQLHCHEH
jgi:hypothetical protein